MENEQKPADEQTKQIETLKAEKAALEAQVAKAVKTEDYEKTVKELNDLKASSAKKAEEEKKAVEKSIADRREALIKRGVPEAKVKNMSPELMEVLETTLEMSARKPGLDMGAGGNAPALSGNLLERTAQAYKK